MYYRPEGMIKPYALNCHIDRHLMNLGHEEDECKRQVINVSPQTGKSIHIVHWVVQYLIKNPDRRVIYISYNDDRAGTIGVDAKNCFKAVGTDLFGYTIDPSLKKKTEWRIDGKQGGLLCCGRGGTITGNPGDVIIFDDPYKNHEEATSPACLDEVKNLWDSTIRSRFQPDTIVIMIQTRWSAEDITGHVLQQERQGIDTWAKLVIPALPNYDVIDSYGELIVKAGGYCECRKPQEMFEQERRTISKYFWDALYDQNPTSMEGSLWQDAFMDKRFFVPRFPDDLKHLVVAMDPASGAEERARGDYTAIVAVGVPGDGAFYVDAELKRSGPEESIERLISFVLALPREPDVVGIEDVGFQKYLQEQAAGKFIAAGINCPVIGMKPVMLEYETGKFKQVKKMTRIIEMLDAIVRAGMLRFIRSSDGCALLIKQLESIPRIGKSIHDDGPDALEMCLRLLAEIQSEKEELAMILER